MGSICPLSRSLSTRTPSEVLLACRGGQPTLRQLDLHVRHPLPETATPTDEEPDKESAIRCLFLCTEYANKVKDTTMTDSLVLAV
jgi:hypothetical protein